MCSFTANHTCIAKLSSSKILFALILEKLSPVRIREMVRLLIELLLDCNGVMNVLSLNNVRAVLLTWEWLRVTKYGCTFSRRATNIFHMKCYLSSHLEDQSIFFFIITFSFDSAITGPFGASKSLVFMLVICLFNVLWTWISNWLLQITSVTKENIDYKIGNIMDLSYQRIIWTEQ